MTSELQRNLEIVRQKIANACARADRDVEDVQIVAVTKAHPVQRMHEALEVGLLDLGENRVQEALPKFDSLPPEARVHLIGRLQTNKVNKVVGRFASIESVDRNDLLARIADRAKEADVRQDIWIQVNVSDEPQKGGCDPAACEELWGTAREASHVRAVGLMTLASIADDEAAARANFARLRALSEGLVRADGKPPRLSMGMSRDYEWAILEGSHQVRLGTVLFGERPPRVPEN